MQTLFIILMFGMLTYWGFLKLQHSLHMLQLSHYDKSRFFSWYKNYIQKAFEPYELLVLAIAFYLMLNNAFDNLFSYILLLTIATFLAFRRENKKAKKPLIYTNRIKRLIITLTIILTLTTIVLVHMSYALSLDINKFIYTYVIIFINFKIIYLLNILALVINSPIENRIRKSYIIKAKSKINEMKNLEVIGVTGSYGKTSTKNILNTLLSTKKHSCVTPKSYNTPMGITRTILENLKPYDDTLICEMGAFKVGEIKENCDLVNPKYGILTAVGPQHLETFLCIDNVRKTKFELINSLPSEGIGVVNIDYEEIELGLKNSNFNTNIITFGIENKNADYRIIKYNFDKLGSTFTVKTKDEKTYDFKMPLLGKHNIYNALGALTLAINMGIDIKLLQQALLRVEVIPHRLEVKEYNNLVIIDDAYNANPVGTKNALEVLEKFEGAKIIITPGMVDLGNQQKELNEEYGNLIADVADYVFIVGDYNKKYLISGLENTGFDKDCIYTVSNLMQATNIITKIKVEKKVVLLANDLTDNYL